MGIRWLILLSFGCAISACNGSTSGSNNKPDLSPPADLAQAAPVDLATVNADAGRDMGPVQKGHPGTAIMSGAVTAQSAHYKVQMSLGQGPGGNGTASSANTKLRGGLVGGTQKQ